MDASSNSYDSKVNFSKVGSVQGFIAYDHEHPNSAEKLKLNVGGDDRLTVTGAGNVGIGANASNPSNTLVVHQDNSGGVTALAIHNNATAANSSTALRFFGADADTDEFEVAQIKADVTDFTDDALDANLVFQTRENASLSTKMTIMNTGSVGIGTSTPTDTLDVRGTIVAPLFKGAINATTMDLDGGTIDGATIGGTTPAAATFTAATVDGSGDATLAIDAAANTNDSILNFDVNGSTVGSVIYDHNGTPTSEQMKFTVNGSPRLYINGDGEVGIGTSSTANELDVEGSMAIGASYSGSTAAPTNGLIVEGNVGIGESSPDQDLEVSNTGEAEIHIDGGTNAVLSLDANADANSSTLQFQKAGTTEGSIVYNHESSDGSELMEFTVGGSTNVYFKGSERLELENPLQIRTLK